MGSLRNRIALLVLAVVTGALTVVFGGVVPTLESTLRSEALRTLSERAQRYSPPIETAIDSNRSTRQVDAAVRDAADSANARVTLFGLSTGDLGLQTFLKSDSTREVEIRDLQFGIALDAARTGRPVTGTESSEEGLVGQAALPLRFTDPETGDPVVGSVVVFTEPLGRVDGQVAVIRNRILAAGLVALVLAALTGYLVAAAIARRARRLEEAANRVAAGDLSARFPVEGDDELAELARALERMRRQLAELDDARSRFIATASHELRTPIFSLGGFLELLEDEEMDDADRRRFVAQVRAQVDRLGKLATDLLDLSKLEAGALQLRPERTDLKALARAVTAEFGPALAAHDSTVELRLPRDSLEAVCDPDRVAQVIRILLDNAITHTPAGTDMVVLASRRDGLLRLGVGDFGPGISRVMMPRIFEPFATSDDAQGSGLGLAIARELAERMSGRLVVDSHPGRTTFTLELPS